MWENYRASECIRPQYMTRRLQKRINRKIGDTVMVTRCLYSGLYGRMYIGEVGEVVMIENYWSYQKAVVKLSTGRIRSFYMGDLRKC